VHHHLPGLGAWSPRHHTQRKVKSASFERGAPKVAQSSSRPSSIANVCQPSTREGKMCIEGVEGCEVLLLPQHIASDAAFPPPCPPFCSRTHGRTPSLTSWCPSPRACATRANRPCTCSTSTISTAGPSNMSSVQVAGKLVDEEAVERAKEDRGIRRVTHLCCRRFEEGQQRLDRQKAPRFPAFRRRERRFALLLYIYRSAKDRHRRRTFVMCA